MAGDFLALYATDVADGQAFYLAAYNETHFQIHLSKDIILVLRIACLNETWFQAALNIIARGRSAHECSDRQRAFAEGDKSPISWDWPFNESNTGCWRCEIL